MKDQNERWISPWHEGAPYYLGVNKESSVTVRDGNFAMAVTKADYDGIGSTPSSWRRLEKDKRWYRYE